jgi:hypothetical protein
MHRKVAEFIGASMGFTFPLIASLGVSECLCFMSFTNRRDGLIFLKVAQLCSAWCYRSYVNTMLVLKYIQRMVFHVVGVLWSCVASTLCLNGMPISMLINDFIYVCMILTCSFMLITTTLFEKERLCQTMIPDPFFAIRKPSTLVCLPLFFSYYKIRKYKKYLYLLYLLIKLSFVLLTCHECLTNTPVKLGTQNYLLVVSSCWKRTIRRTTIFSREFYINPQVTLVGKNNLPTWHYAWSPNDWQYKE